ncbi:MAG: hypothetical protein AUI13_03255 [Gemmatimonadetes bacterium 13_2_20CM_2_69_23]|nr:MAG: hypothetical protein AUI13_03255 [Gemmatimonadetes bacterium 13_2_20CM_2_69_23]
MLRGVSTLSALASELLARLPTMTDEERRLGLEVYRQLARGEPVLRLSLAEALDVPTHDVDELLGHPNLKCLTYSDNDGRIIGFGGLAVRKMPHRFRIDGRTLYTWCAWDSRFLPGILDHEAEVDYIFFFPDRNNAAAWARRQPDTTVISVSEAFELGRLMVRTRWRS